jgi:subtilase family serine protease
MHATEDAYATPHMQGGLKLREDVSLKARLPQQRWIIGITTTALVAAMVFLATSIAHAGSANANPNSNGYTISNNTPGFIKNAHDLGAVDPNEQIAVTVWLHLHNGNKLDQLVHDQNTKGSSSYHQWLTQDQFDATYAPTAQEVNSVENFLTAHKLSVVTVAENNFYVKVQGAVGDIEKAFHVQIDNFNYQGFTYQSNTADPNINDPSGAHVAAISGMDDFGFQPTLVHPVAAGETYTPIKVGSGSNGLFFEGQCFRGVESHSFSAKGVSATYSGNRYGADISNTTLGHLAPCGYQPSEMQTAYNMNALYTAGLAGAGQTVVITDAFGDATIQNDAEVFSQIYGLPDLNSSNFQVLRAPGAVNNPVNNGHIGPGADWAGEITLDVEWVHAMAPLAHIDLVIGPNNGSDLDEAINYAVVHHLGNVITNSWASIETGGNTAHYIRDNRILEQAAAEGIDVNFSSGDSGDYAAAVGFKTVSFPASSPFATAIGGTSLGLNSDDTIAFQTGWGTNLTEIADKAALGNPPKDPPFNEGFIYGAGGGSSFAFAKPSWQSGLPGTTRQVPDVSMLADPYTGVEIIETVGGQLSVGVIGGTSLASPMFSAIMAIACEKAGHGLGQAAPLLYGLASSTGTSTPIYDVTDISSAHNVTGSITDSSGTTSYSADQLAGPLDGTTQYISAFYNSPFSTRWFVIVFGTDSSLTTNVGWDNVTGVGTPNGANFVNAVG